MLDPIQSLWIGNSLSVVEQLCIKSFIDNGHQFILYTYDEIQNLPKEVIIKDANQIITKENIFVYRDGWGKGSYAGFADLFRFMLLKKNGGWWVDTDVICLKPFNFTTDFIVCSSYEGEWGACPNSCILKAPPDHIFANYILDEIASIDFNTVTFGQIGPSIVQKAIKTLKLEHNVAPYYYFNPIAWSNVGDIILKQASLKEQLKEVVRPIFKPHTLKGRILHKDTYAIHLWNEVWRQSGYNKNETYPHYSIFEKLKRKYGVK